VDVRVIAATNRNLEEAVRAGRFREDLYYRLKVIPILLPPLRERREDIPLLVQHFLDHYNREFHKNTRTVSPEAMEVLIRYPWHGNIRELKNVMEQTGNNQVRAARLLGITRDTLRYRLKKFGMGEAARAS
jgi:transcriptional regulator with PAS, ATPase and Fis domain